MSFWYLESFFMISRIGTRSKWHFTSPEVEYEMSVTMRSYLAYSSRVRIFNSVSLVAASAEYIEPERSTTMMLWATDLPVPFTFSRGRSLASAR
jgi:dUTPase